MHVYLGKDQMEYYAEIAENMTGNEDDGVYTIESVVRERGRGVWARQRPYERHRQQLDMPRLKTESNSPP